MLLLSLLLQACGGIRMGQTPGTFNTPCVTTIPVAHTHPPRQDEGVRHIRDMQLIQAQQAHSIAHLQSSSHGHPYNTLPTGL